MSKTFSDPRPNSIQAMLASRIPWPDAWLPAAAPASNPEKCMLCPVCKTVNLAMLDRQGIEVDYCPQCRGIWLDRGELDRLIERAERAAAPTAPAPPPYARNHPHPREYPDARGHGRKRHKSLLGELFDF